MAVHRNDDPALGRSHLGWHYPVLGAAPDRRHHAGGALPLLWLFFWLLPVLMAGRQAGKQELALASTCTNLDS
eukprot:SAG22_NODE_890_length_6647_cov_68.631185_6_plen_73_part_00